MAVKILIRRRVFKEVFSELQPLLQEIRKHAMAQPGYISGETLINHEDNEEYLVISTWQSVKHWKDWYSSEKRNELQYSVDLLLGQPTEYSIYEYR